MLVSGIFIFVSNAGLNTADGWSLLVSSTLRTIPLVTLVPRFILNLREIHGRDLQGRRGSNIDTAFGLGTGFGESAVRSGFADAEWQNGSEEQGNEIEMEIQEVGRTSSLA